MGCAVGMAGPRALERSVLPAVLLRLSVVSIGLRIGRQFTGGFQDQLADRLVGFFGQIHDLAELFGLEIVSDVQV